MRNLDFGQPPNRVLRNLPLAEMKTVHGYSTRIRVDRDAVLFKPGEPIKTIYFPETAIISVLGGAGQSGRLELWSVGNEGIAGVTGIISGLSPYQKVVQTSGDVLVAPASIVRKHFGRRGAFHDEILRYYESLLVQVAQLGFCNSRHCVEQRLCRWLLLMHDRTGLRTLQFTQDFIAAILGTRRATISVAAAELQQAGWIRYAPGSITIQSRRGLQGGSCSCYRKLRELS